MDEYEKVETDLQKQYVVYVEKHCHLSYLEHQLDLVNQAEHNENKVNILYNILTRWGMMNPCHPYILVRPIGS